MTSLGWRGATAILLLCVTTFLSAQDHTVRFATFNVSFHFGHRGELATKLEGGQWQPARKVAAIIQKTAPDVLLLNEFDGDDDRRGLEIFVKQYLAVPQLEQTKRW